MAHPVQQGSLKDSQTPNPKLTTKVLCLHGIARKAYKRCSFESLYIQEEGQKLNTKYRPGDLRNHRLTKTTKCARTTASLKASGPSSLHFSFIIRPILASEASASAASDLFDRHGRGKQQSCEKGKVGNQYHFIMGLFTCC